MDVLVEVEHVLLPVVEDNLVTASQDTIQRKRVAWFDKVRQDVLPPRNISEPVNLSEEFRVMKKLTIISILAFAVVLGFSPPAQAQGSEVVISIDDFERPGREIPEITPGPGWLACPQCQNPDQIQASRERYQAENPPFDPPDIFGVWSAGNGVTLDFDTLPPLTPYGQQLWEATQALENPREPTGAKNGGPGSQDPMMLCDPLGYPRAFTYNYGMEFAQLPDRVLQFFEWGHTWRTIWTDGRALPPEPPQPRFYGYAVGRWEGDTFVVESNGYEASTWLDQDRRTMTRGMPHSDEMRVVERWTRTSYGTMEAELTIIDPKVYTEPWTTTGEVIFRPDIELWEYACVPSYSDFYNTRVVGLEGFDRP